MPRSNRVLRIRSHRSGGASTKWIACDDKKMLADFERKHQDKLAFDAEGQLTFLAPSSWHLNYAMEQWPGVSFRKTREYN